MVNQHPLVNYLKPFQIIHPEMEIFVEETLLTVSHDTLTLVLLTYTEQPHLHPLPTQCHRHTYVLWVDKQQENVSVHTSYTCIPLIVSVNSESRIPSTLILRNTNR